MTARSSLGFRAKVFCVVGGLCTLFVGAQPAQAETDTLRRARRSNGIAIAAVLWDIGLSVEAYAVNRRPTSTLEDQKGYDGLIGGFRAVGMVGALSSVSHLKELNQDVNQIPVFASAASSFGGLILAMETGGAKRDLRQQETLTVLRVASGGLVATQTVFNRLAIRPLVPPRPMASSVRLTVGASHVALVGSF